MSWNRCRALLAAALAALTVGASSAPANAEGPLKITYLCDFSLMGLEPWEVSFETPLRGEWPRGRALSGVTADVTVTWNPNSWTWADTLAARYLSFVEAPGISQGAHLVGGVSSPGSHSDLALGIALPTLTLPTRKQSLVFQGQTTLPSWTPQEAGTARVAAGSLLFNMEWRDADGNRIDVPKTEDDRDLDGDYLTFETYCNPATAQDRVLDDDGIWTGEMYEDQDLRLVDLTIVDGPTAPTDAKVSAIGEREATLSFGSSITAPAGAGITRYEVLRNGVKIADIGGHDDIERGSQRTYRLGGLTPNTRYTLSVVAIDQQGRRSNVTAIEPFTTQDWQQRTMALTGEITMPKLLRNAAPLRGTLELRSERTSGESVAEIALQPTRARMVTLGMIPLTADVAFIRSGSARGVLEGGQLSLEQTFRVRLNTVYMYGAIPIAAGSTCQSKRLSTVQLTSSPAGFSFAGGGPLQSQFELSDLTGCGFLNGLVSPLTASAGNTLALQADVN